MANSRKVTECLSKIYAAQRKLVPFDGLILKKLCDQLLKQRAPEQKNFFAFHFNQCHYYHALEAFCRDEVSFQTRESLQNKIQELSTALAKLAKPVKLSSELSAIFIAFFTEYPDVCDEASLKAEGVVQEWCQLAKENRKQRRAKTLKFLMESASSQTKEISEVAQKELLSFVGDDQSENAVIIQTFLKLKNDAALVQLAKDPRVKDFAVQLLVEFPDANKQTRVRYCRLLADAFEGDKQRQFNLMALLLDDPDDELVINAFDSLCKLTQKNPNHERVALVHEKLTFLLNKRFKDASQRSPALFQSLSLLNIEDHALLLKTLEYYDEIGARDNAECLTAKIQAMQHFIHVDPVRQMLQSLILISLRDPRADYQVVAASYDALEMIGSKQQLDDVYFEQILACEANHPDFLTERLSDILSRVKLTDQQQAIISRLLSDRIKAIIELPSGHSSDNDSDQDDDSDSDEKTRTSINKIYFQPNWLAQQCVSQRLGVDLVKHIKLLCRIAGELVQFDHLIHMLMKKIEHAVNVYCVHLHDREKIKRDLCAILIFTVYDTNLNADLAEFFINLFQRQGDWLSDLELLGTLSESHLVFSGTLLNQLLSILQKMYVCQSSGSDLSTGHNETTLQHGLMWLAAMNVPTVSDKDAIAKFFLQLAQDGEPTTRCAAYSALLIIAKQYKQPLHGLERTIERALRAESALGLIHSMPLVSFALNRDLRNKLADRLCQIASIHENEKVRWAACDQLFRLAKQGSSHAINLIMGLLKHDTMLNQQAHLAHLINTYYDHIANNLNHQQRRALLAKTQTVIEYLKTNPAAKLIQSILEVKFLSYDVISNASIQQPYLMPESSSSVSLAN